MDSMGKVYISQSHKEAGDAQPISLLAAQHFVCKVSAPFGSSSSAAPVDFEVAVLSRPRLCNCNGLRLLPSIYIALGMKVCQGVLSKWINKSIPRWTSFISELFKGRHILASNHRGNGATTQSLPLDARMLPSHAVLFCIVSE